MQWIALSAEQGCSQAQSQLAEFYMDKNEYALAAKFHKLSAEQGSSYAQRRMGDHCLLWMGRSAG